ncbi:MAG: alpha-D-ribose 1-methylphosphonate 5-triphosphate diphosphatase, partial [Hydrogenophaga sp.]
MNAVTAGDPTTVGGSAVFRNARLVLPTEVVHGSLRVDGGRIHAIEPGNTAVAGGIDCAGDYLLPGLVEMHTDNFERHLMPRPKVQWATLPALIAHDAEIAAAGITTVFDALGVGDADPDSLRGSTWREVIDTLEHTTQAGLLRADHHLHVR